MDRIGDLAHPPAPEDSTTTDPTAAPTPAEIDELRHSLGVADALAGTLNLRRALARVADLAVPAVGSWAGATVWGPAGVHQASRGPGHARHERFVDGWDGAWAGSLSSLAAAGPASLGVADGSALEEMGAAPDDAAALLEGGQVTVHTYPLRAHGGAIGILAVVRDDGGDPGTRLAALGERAARALAAARVYEERSTLAATLRASLLPAPLPEPPGIRLGASYRPAEEAAEIGGDFYDVREDGTGWSLTLGDVCGKGVGAAVLTGQARQSLRTASLLTDDPGERLRLLNSAMRAVDGRSFLTVLHGILIPAHGSLSIRLASGGHPPPYLMRSDGQVVTVPVKGTLIGMLPTVKVPTTDIRLHPGDTLLCLTDGLVESRGNDGRFGDDRLVSLLSDCAGMAAQAITERLIQAVMEFLDGNAHDDIAVVAVQAA